MIRLFRWLIWGDGHAHHWKIIRQGSRVAISYPSGREFANGYYYDLQCEKCGIVRVKNT